MILLLSLVSLMKNMEYASCLEKRIKEEGAADDEGEGVSLPEEKKFKDDLHVCLPIDFSRLRLGEVQFNVYMFVLTTKLNCYIGQTFCVWVCV